MVLSLPQVLRSLVWFVCFSAFASSFTHALTKWDRYVYDFLDIFRAALEDIWAAYLPGANAHLTAIGSKTPLRRPEHVLHAVELVLDGNTTGDGLKEVTRAPGLNEVGMVAWLLTLYTPEVKEGRQVVLIANDITHHIGSFGPDEDELFRRASVLARARRIPRLYLAANSGARIGLAAEVRDAFRVRHTLRNHCLHTMSLSIFPG